MVTAATPCNFDSFLNFRRIHPGWVALVSGTVVSTSPLEGPIRNKIKEKSRDIQCKHPCDSHKGLKQRIRAWRLGESLSTMPGTRIARKSASSSPH